MPNKMISRLRAEKDLHRRRLLLVGYLCDQLKSEGVGPILVGGNAVELYTFNDYTTHDIDLVTARRDRIGQILESIGFSRLPGARHWHHNELELSVEIPDDVLAGDESRVVQVEIDEFVADVIGIEDLLIDRLNAYVHWHSVSDFEQALKIYHLHRDSIDEDYLFRKAKDDQLEDALRELKRF